MTIVFDEISCCWEIWFDYECLAFGFDSRKTAVEYFSRRFEPLGYGYQLAQGEEEE